MPTCGVYAARADIKQWKDFRVVEKEFLFFDYPKNHS
jgi:phosphohistidine phosphatase